MFFFVLEDVDVETEQAHIKIYVNSAIMNDGNGDDLDENSVSEFLDQQIRKAMVAKNNCLDFTATDVICAMGI